MEIQTFVQFIQRHGLTEAAVEPADAELDVTIDDVLLDSGKEIKGSEILGVIVASKTEKEFLDYFYSEYGNSSFTETDTQTLAKFYNEYQEEINKKEQEQEEEAAGGEEDPLADDGDIDI